jgi:hypothetical protein
MVETRSRRKSVAPAGGGDGDATAPSSSGRAAAANGSPVDYADLYRQEHLRQQRAVQASFLRRWKSRIYLTYHQQAMTWGWYMLEPWEVALWMSLLALIFYAVVAACFINPKSICNTTLVALRNSLAAQGAKLLSFTR